MIDVSDEDGVAGEAPLLLSEVDAALSGETSLDHESAAEWAVTVRMMGTSIDLLASFWSPRAQYVSPTRLSSGSGGS